MFFLENFLRKLKYHYNKSKRFLKLIKKEGGTKMKDVTKVDGKELRNAIKSLNDSGLIEEGIKLKGLTKSDMVEKFLNVLAEAQKTMSIKEQKQLPKEVVKMYNTLIDLEDAEKEEKKSKTKLKTVVKTRSVDIEPKKDQLAPKDEKVTTTAKGKEVVETNNDIEDEQKKEKIKKTRQQVFFDIMIDGGGTKKELIIEMEKRFMGSTAEAKYQVGVYISLLSTFNIIKKDDSGKIVLC